MAALQILFGILLITLTRFEKTTGAELDPVALCTLKVAATKLSTPFTEGALQRLEDDQLFGSSYVRVARSTVVVIMNKSNRKYHLTAHKCLSGVTIPKAYPDDVIEPHSSVAYGVESKDLNSGLECSTLYWERTDHKTNFNLKISNPLTGDNLSSFKTNGPMSMYHFIGKGEHNIVRYVIE